jgi:hypothetical protein
MNPVRLKIRSLGLRLSGALGPHPSLYLPLAHAKYRWEIRGTELDGMRPNPDAHPPPVDRRVEIVIEGFPRSANSFAVAAFRLPQDRFLHIAHHRHVAAQVIGGVRLGIPVLVLVRHPEDAVLSLVTRHPNVPVELALKNYARFYGPILRLADHFVCANFEQVTTDFGVVVRRLNARFGSTFREFEHTSENVAECFFQIERHHRRQTGERHFEAMVPRPSPEKPLRTESRETFHSAPLTPLRDRAYELFGLFHRLSLTPMPTGESSRDER